MGDPTPHEITSQPGIQRDGTQLDSLHYLDGLWCRFAKNRPKKIGGYKSITQTLPEVLRGLSHFAVAGNSYFHGGSQSFLTQVETDKTGNIIQKYDRTPSGFAVDPANLWQFDFLFDPVAKITNLIAHAAPNLVSLTSTVETPIYYGQVDATGVLTATGMDNQSGGVVVLEPFLVTYGNGGRVDISNPNDLVTPNPNSASITSSKIMKALVLPGQNGPAGIFWSTDSVIVGTYAGINQGVLAFNTISAESSILSAQGVVEYDGVYYWAGGDRFLMFNGVVRDIPNELNSSFFFDNVNMVHRQKVFAFRVPRWGEIWWCFPLGSATECNHAVVYNVRYNTWYDTPLPDAGRSAAVFSAPFPRPVMSDLDLTTNGYTLWQHEYGVDKVVGSSIKAIESYFQTSFISAIIANPAVNKNTRVARVEPDFVQAGEMSLTVLGQANARAVNVNSLPFVFPDLSGTPLDAGDQLVETKTERRLLSFLFSSNTPGGNFWGGKIIAHLEPTDGRVTT